jgi:glycosyltransferase involved in cell wall biosynthesis
MADETPTVSVVIPTRNRPDLLRNALDSVLAQTFVDFEIVVVVDGPDPATEDLLRAEPDSRLRFQVSAVAKGGGAARNEAIRRANGHWIAFLDDDDLWMPMKLERQLQRLRRDGDEVVSFTRLIARAPHGSYVWPRRGPRVGEHVSEYLFARTSLFAGEGGIQTSTIVAPRRLALAYPLDESLRRLQDTDWLLRVVAAGARLDFCPEVLTIWRIEGTRATITSENQRDWRLLYDWIAAHRQFVTPKAYAAFLLVRGGGATSAALDPRGAVTVWREAFRHGRPAPIHVLLFVVRWILPAGIRRWIRARLSPGKTTSGAGVSDSSGG